jgi:hypothetical protein
MFICNDFILSAEMIQNCSCSPQVGLIKQNYDTGAQRSVRRCCWAAANGEGNGWAEGVSKY